MAGYRRQGTDLALISHRAHPYDGNGCLGKGPKYSVPQAEVQFQYIIPCPVPMPLRKRMKGVGYVSMYLPIFQCTYCAPGVQPERHSISHGRPVAASQSDHSIKPLNARAQAWMVVLRWARRAISSLGQCFETLQRGTRNATRSPAQTVFEYK